MVTSAHRVTLRFFQAGKIPDKVFSEGKARLKAEYTRPILSPGDVSWAIKTSVIPVFEGVVQEAKSVGVHRHAERMLDERLDTRVSILTRLAEGYSQLDQTFRNVPYPLETAEDYVRYYISDTLKDAFKKKVPTLGHAFKSQFRVDPANLNSLVRKVLKKATPQQLEALRRNATGEITNEDYVIKSRFLDQVAPTTTVARLLKTDKITIDFTRWFESLKEILATSYAQETLAGFDSFNIGDMKVIVVDPNTDTFDINDYAKRFTEARALLRTKGFEKLWYGLMVVNSKEFKQLSEAEKAAYKELGYLNLTNSAGTYHSGEDRVRITAPPNNQLVSTVVHELGHRYWFKFMSPPQRARFNALVKTNPSEKVRDFPSGDKDEDGVEKPVAPVSDYGKSSIEEAFAEVFEHYVLNKDMARNQIESFKKVLTKTAAEKLVERFAAETTTRQVGMCGFCENTFKLRNGKLVLHGFERPGYGYTLGQCPGVGMDPYEVSVEGAKKGKAWMEGNLRNIDSELDRVKRDPESFEVETRGKVHTIKELLDRQSRPRSDGFKTPSREQMLEDIVRSVVNTLEGKKRQTEINLKRYQNLIRNWKPVALTSVEEQTSQRQDIKDEKSRKTQEAKELKFQSIKATLLKKLPKVWNSLKSAEKEYRPHLGKGEYQKDIALKQTFDAVYDLVWSAVSKIEELKMKDQQGSLIPLHDLCKRLGIDEILEHLGFESNGRFILGPQSRNDISGRTPWKPDWPGFYR